ncbi:MAG TPA: nucleotidyltransferase family protein [Dongiaceae bacterium]|nr:nucleotidyltransferase family protein [Dongiaceae bacterium]
MKAMVLAAGLGTRLRPLTDSRPKALVEVGGRTLLEITLTRLKQFGVREAIVNVHHFADMVVEYLRARDNFGMKLAISREDNQLLDTGGGLKKAAWFFEKDDEPFFLHNVDVVSTINLARMAEVHAASGAIATLAVMERDSSRLLLFDEGGALCGRRGEVRPTEPERPGEVAYVSLAFCGIHVISPRLLGEIRETGAFSIIDVYLRLAEKGQKIQGFRADDEYWRDLGKPQSVAAAERDLAAGKFQ